MKRKESRLPRTQDERDSRDHIIISSRSRWPDFVWYLDNRVPGNPYSTLSWHFSLPDGSWSTDSQHFELLESFREVLWGMLQDGGSYGRTLKPASMTSHIVGVRSLFRWMVYRDLPSLGQLNPELLRTYLEELPFLIVQGGSYFDVDEELSEDEDDVNFQSEVGSELDADLGDSDQMDSEEGDSTRANDSGESIDEELQGAEAELASDKADDGATYSQVVSRISIIYFIHAQSQRLEARKFGTLNEPPFEGKNIRDVVRTVAAYTFNRTPPLPDEVALPLLRTAIAWIEVRAKDVVAMQDLYLARTSEHLGRGLLPVSARALARRSLLNYQFSIDRATGLPWRGPLQNRHEGESVSYPGNVDVPATIPTVMRYNMMRVRDAAMTILEYLVGIRPSEVCAIPGGMNDETGLPSCVLIKRSNSGLLELFYMKSVLSKGVEQPQPSDWLIGCRPADCDALPLTVVCLTVLQRLFEPWRKLGGFSNMLVGISTRTGLPQSADGVRQVTTVGLARSFQTFVQCEVDLSGLPDESIRGENLIDYRRKKGKNISPRQGRKTFAAFMLESRASLLPAVKDHFKHLNIATTERAYYPQAARLRNDIDSVIISDTVTFFAEAVKRKKIVGRKAGDIEKYFSSEEFTDVKDPAELDRRIRHVVIFHDLRIFFHDHGKCLITADPLESRCRQETGTASWENVTPDYSVRNPGMCAGCGAFAADRSNRPFWERRFAQYTKAYEAAKGKGREHEYHVHLARAQQAAQVIKWFDGAEIGR
ncbi:hypothetical protein [Burkholderia sp. Bp9143]|uniref:hypothetical protein n=1 Tax=Burkholderia sp. Bp9143 TaxID=2184574 RepID=UPI000F59BB71|nr:hypothetical protein [Burkholderia sp. Bp9143]